MKVDKEYMDRLGEIVTEVENCIEADESDAILSHRTAFDILYMIRDLRNAITQLYYERNERKANHE